jgi:glutamate dehydrogenase (NAD(P)+)
MVRTYEVKPNALIPLDGKDEEFALVVISYHPLEEGGEAVATTAIHRRDFRRHIGGMRIVESKSIPSENDQLREVGKLARGMTWKCALALIPADGQKTVVAAPDWFAKNADVKRKAQLLAEHCRLVIQEDDGVIFGPDMNVGEDVQDELSGASDLLDHITGLSEGRGGLSIDFHGYTGLGLFEALRTAVPSGLTGMTAGVQGFGAVGAHTSLLLHNAGVRVRAVNTKSRAIVSSGNEGLDIPTLFARYREQNEGCLDGYSNPGVTGDADPDKIFDERMDLFVPAARTGVLASYAEQQSGQVENNQARDIEVFLRSSGVRVIAEAANAPLTAGAESIAENEGVLVLPDYAVNSGGLIGCWREWEVRHKHGGVGESAKAAVAAITQDTKAEVRAVVSNVVKALLEAGVPFRAAANRLADQRRRDLLNGQ